ncbi:MAG: hypothetical protein V2I97_15935 [Desulfococcaceae bacterium]|nr:hypothetical protein [Desulfococcaceae bacterium]
MKIIAPLAGLVALMLICVSVFYFYSPQHELTALRSENTLLTKQLADAQGDNSEDVIAVVVIGFCAITAILLIGFFLILCLLSNTRPADFFMPSVFRCLDGPAAEHRLITKPTTSGNPAEIYTEIYPVGERYTMEWGA